MKFSVVIPTFNRSHFVGLAIESVLRQSLPCWEIIVVDDGSTDDTRTVVKQFGAGVRYVYKDNGGASSARNAGVKLATGNWIAFLDSDDEWMENYLAAQADNLAMRQSAVLSLTNAVTREVDGESRDLFEVTKFSDAFSGQSHLFSERPLELIVRYRSWFLQSGVFRKSALSEVGLFDESFSIGEDFDLISRVALVGPFVFDKRPLVVVFRRQQDTISLTVSSRDDEIGRQRRFNVVYEKLLGLRGLSFGEQVAVRKALSSHRRALGNALLRAERRAEARAQYLSSLRFFPHPAGLVRYLESYLASRNLE
jgi:glycosyltransferase involved in cell wall biosynthesis